MTDQPVIDQPPGNRAVSLDRRTALRIGGAGLALTTIGGLGALAQRKPPGPDTVSIDQLMKPGVLPDLAIGKVDAPVTIVEYASMTCGHCANFHNKVYPALKERYVDTGKVRFIFREFPLDPLAVAGSMLARCAGKDKVENAYAMNSILFAKQEQWAFVRTNPVPELFKIAQQAGFTQDSFDKCLTDDKLMADVEGGREAASKAFSINATPTFFINGRRFTDRADQIEAFAKAIDPLVPKS